MNTVERTSPIGVFDSGVGGISVLSELIKHLPGEEFVYLADSANAPYGTKGCECVRNLSVNAARRLLAEGIKSLVVACNTATSVAIQHIRNEFDIPVIGMEPALKPAVEAGKPGKIVVMATPLTLREDKFNRLFEMYNSKGQIIPLPCPGLAEIIESWPEPGQIQNYLETLFKELDISKISSIVLGCTHYCLIKKEISDFAGANVLIVDGNEGTARHLKSILTDNHLLNEQKAVVRPLGYQNMVRFLTTGDNSVIIPMCEKFLKKTLDAHGGSND